MQNLWTAKAEPGLDALQVWFPGVHCDVGGGYPEDESGLSTISLQWMVREAEAAGLQLSTEAKAEIFTPHATGAGATTDVIAKKHESLNGLWWIPELIPKRVKDPSQNFEPRWIIPLGHSRAIGAGAAIHSSVFERQRKDPTYIPRNIPTQYIEAP